jgi:hypothetical protein
MQSKNKSEWHKELDSAACYVEYTANSVGVPVHIVKLVFDLVPYFYCTRTFTED